MKTLKRLLFTILSAIAEWLNELLWKRYSWSVDYGFDSDSWRDGYKEGFESCCGYHRDWTPRDPHPITHCPKCGLPVGIDNPYSETLGLCEDCQFTANRLKAVNKGPLHTFHLWWHYRIGGWWLYNVRYNTVAYWLASRLVALTDRVNPDYLDWRDEVAFEKWRQRPDYANNFKPFRYRYPWSNKHVDTAHPFR